MSETEGLKEMLGVSLGIEDGSPDIEGASLGIELADGCDEGFIDFPLLEDDFEH